MTDAHLLAAFASLDRHAPGDELDLVGLHVVLDRAHRRRTQRRLAGVAGVVGIAAATFWVVLPTATNHDRLLPAHASPSPLTPARLGPQAGQIGWLPRGAGVLELPSSIGTSRMRYFRLPHVGGALAETLTPAQMLVFAVAPLPENAYGDARTDGIPVMLTYNAATYFPPRGADQLAVISWSDRFFNYRLQAPLRKTGQTVGLTYSELLRIADSVPRATDIVDRGEPSQPPHPAGYLPSPGPDITDYFGPMLYVRAAAADARPRVSRAKALRLFNEGPFATEYTDEPYCYLGLLTRLPRVPVSTRTGSAGTPALHGRLVWVLRDPANAVAAGKPTSHPSHIDYMIIDATTGEALLAETTMR